MSQPPGAPSTGKVFAWTGVLVVLFILAMLGRVKDDWPKLEPEKPRVSSHRAPSSPPQSSPQQDKPPSGIAAYYDRIFTMKDTVGCFPTRDDVRLGARAVVNRDNEAIAGMLEEGRIWMLSAGTPVRTGHVYDGIAVTYPQLGRYLEKKCYMPLQVLLNSEKP